MDHRWGQRLQTKYNTLLYEQGVPVASGKTKNLGKGGIFIELSPGACPKSKCVDVEIRVPSGLMKGKYRLPVMIVRRSDEGVGMMFRQLDKDDENLVSSLLSEAERNPEELQQSAERH